MVMLEDSIMIKGNTTTAGSKMLQGFVPPFSATVADRLAQAGIKTAQNNAWMCEFGIPALFDDSTEQSALGAVKAVAEGTYNAALCNDIFGLYRKQAALEGMYYIHPTYGTVSRYGLIPVACSMDQIGVLCKDLPEGFRLLSHIAGHDERDGAMFAEKQYNYTGGVKNIRIGLSSCAEDIVLPTSLESVRISLSHFDVYGQIMRILSFGEASNNLSRYDGIKFGFRAEDHRGINDLYLKSRSQGFGLQTKLTIIAGAMVLSQDHYVPYYEKAMKIRRLIKESLPFDKCDVIALPCRYGGTHYQDMALYALANLAGLPSISFKYKDQHIQLIADAKNENALLSAWEVMA